MSEAINTDQDILSPEEHREIESIAAEDVAEWSAALEKELKDSD
jgi:hypothetical protein